MHVSNRRIGSSLIELLVVMAILATLTAILLPAVQLAREAADRAACTNNMRQMGIALHLYHDGNLMFPPGFTATNYDGKSGSAPGWGWAAYLLPYIEENNVSSSIDYTQNITAAPAAIATVVKTYICPSDIVPLQAVNLSNQGIMVGPSSYVGICGSSSASTTATQAADQTNYAQNGVFYCNSQISLVQITDGASNTAMCGERAFANVIGTWVGAVPGCTADVGAQSPYALANPGSAKIQPGSGQGSGDLVLCCSAPNNNVYTSGSRGLNECSSKHPNGSNYLFADGSVHFIWTVVSTNTVALANLNALGTMAGGEIVDQSLFP